MSDSQKVIALVDEVNRIVSVHVRKDTKLGSLNKRVTPLTDAGVRRVVIATGLKDTWAHAAKRVVLGCYYGLGYNIANRQEMKRMLGI